METMICRVRPAKHTQRIRYLVEVEAQASQVLFIRHVAPELVRGVRLVIMPKRRQRA